MEDNGDSDYELAGRILGVPSTVFGRKKVECQDSLFGPPRARVASEPLSEAEFEIIRPHLPRLPVPKPGVDFDDRAFVGAALFYISARTARLGWVLLPEDVYGCRSSREKRWSRWVMAGTWERLAEALAGDERLTQVRRDGFSRLASDATARRARILAARDRLTNAVS